jgi:hypothetical protein
VARDAAATTSGGTRPRHGPAAESASVRWRLGHVRGRTTSGPSEAFGVHGAGRGLLYRCDRRVRGRCRAAEVAPYIRRRPRGLVDVGAVLRAAARIRQVAGVRPLDPTRDS